MGSKAELSSWLELAFPKKPWCLTHFWRFYGKRVWGWRFICRISCEFVATVQELAGVKFCGEFIAAVMTKMKFAGGHGDCDIRRLLYWSLLAWCLAVTNAEVYIVVFKE